MQSMVSKKIGLVTGFGAALGLALTDSPLRKPVKGLAS